MKFVCHNCMTQYTISEEKVRNKRLKIRCKKCEAIIEVVDPAAAGRVSIPLREVSSFQRIPASDTEAGPVAGPSDAAPAVTLPPIAPVSPSAEQRFFGDKAALDDNAPLPVAGGRKSPKPYLFISGAFFVTALVVLGVVLLGGGAEERPPEVRTEERIVEKVVYRDRLVTVKSDEASEASEVEVGRTSASSRGARARRSAAKKRAEEARAEALIARMSASVPESGRSIGAATETASSGSGRSSGSDGLSAGQMKRIVNGNKAAMKSCYERSLKKGEAPSTKDVRVNFKVTVGASGTVTRVSLSGEGARLSLLSSCLSQSVKRWVFPTSNRESSLEFPFVFTPTR